MKKVYLKDNVKWMGRLSCNIFWNFLFGTVEVAINNYQALLRGFHIHTPPHPIAPMLQLLHDI